MQPFHHYFAHSFEELMAKSFIVSAMPPENCCIEKKRSRRLSCSCVILPAIELRLAGVFGVCALQDHAIRGCHRFNALRTRSGFPDQSRDDAFHRRVSQIPNTGAGLPRDESLSPFRVIDKRDCGGGAFSLAFAEQRKKRIGDERQRDRVIKPRRRHRSYVFSTSFIPHFGQDSGFS
ncbi:MAG: hypothetical protein M3429_04320, partial [Verrucomicrobiota bacterium]|nr:hypothetical protein [Verrucomicrobiota bacterium]